MVLARWEIPHIAEQEFRDVSPGRPENKIEWRGIKRRVDAVGCEDYRLPYWAPIARFETLTTSSHTSLSSSSLHCRVIRNESRNRLDT